MEHGAMGVEPQCWHVRLWEKQLRSWDITSCQGPAGCSPWAASWSRPWSHAPKADVVSPCALSLLYLTLAQSHSFPTSLQVPPPRSSLWVTMRQ